MTTISITLLYHSRAAASNDALFSLYCATKLHNHNGSRVQSKWIAPLRKPVNSLRPSDAFMRQWTNHHCFRQWLVAWPAPSHYLNQCWDIVNWTLRNKLHWNFNRYSYIFIQENSFENVVWKMAAILSRPQCVKITPYFLPLFTYRRHIENKVGVTDVYGTPQKCPFLNTHLCFKHTFSSKRHCCKYSFTTYYWSDTNTLSKLRPNREGRNKRN